MATLRVDWSLTASRRALGSASRSAPLVKAFPNFSGGGELCFEMIVGVEIGRGIHRPGPGGRPWRRWQLLMLREKRGAGYVGEWGVGSCYLSNNRLEPTMRRSISMFEGGVVVGVGAGDESAAAQPRR